MRREIKFRAWNKDDNEMLSWEDLISQGYELYELQDSGKHAHIFMQYIGLKDKNGREIYEGDIIQSDSTYPSVVEFQDGCFLVDSTTFIEKESIYPDTEWEVIGNIYETPELLKKKA